MEKCVICHGPLKFLGSRNGDTFCDKECYYYFIENHPDCIDCKCSSDGSSNSTHNTCGTNGEGNTHKETCIGYISNNNRMTPRPFLRKKRKEIAPVDSS